MKPEDNHSHERVTRIIDVKFPVPWLLTVAAAIIGGGYGIYHKLDNVVEDVGELKIAVKSGNQAAATVQGELAILKFRVENIESDIKTTQRSKP